MPAEPPSLNQVVESSQSTQSQSQPKGNQSKTRSRPSSPEGYPACNSDRYHSNSVQDPQLQAQVQVQGEVEGEASFLSTSTTQSTAIQNKHKRARTDSPAPALASASTSTPDPAQPSLPVTTVASQSNLNLNLIDSNHLPSSDSNSDSNPHPPATGSVWLRNTFVPRTSNLSQSSQLSTNMAQDQLQHASDPSSSSISISQPSTTTSQPPPTVQSSSPSSIPIKDPTVPKSQLPSNQEQLNKIKALKNKSLNVDETWFVLPRRWYQIWATKCSLGGESLRKPEPGEEEGGAGFAEDELEMELGPISTMELLENAASCNEAIPPLKVGLGVGSDVEVVPEEAWELLQSWYGVQGPSFSRKVISRYGDLRIEMYPPRFNFVRIITEGAADKKALPAPSTLSISSTYQELINVAKQSFGYWRGLPNAGFRLIRVPTEVEKTIAGIELKLDEDIEYDWEPINGQDEKATLNDLQLDLPYQILALESTINSTFFRLALKGHPNAKTPRRVPLFSQTKGNDSFSGLEKPKETSTLTSAFKDSSSSFGLNSGGYNTRSSTFYERSLNRTSGVTGLQNLGNTCFMNSALQCLSNTPQLQNYFLEGAYKKEINPDNPLGMQGLLAESFGNLLQKLWSSSGGSFAPREFKQVLGKFAPQFLGYSQQDTQELLAFLLDGLHEDLNRILKKPYVELPDWEGGDDSKMIEFARVQWELYKKRNDSVIVDLFQGQYKSTLVCPVCSNISIKFDPFMYLTLPIPNKRKKNLTVYFVSLDLLKPTMKLLIQVNEDDSISKLKTKIFQTLGMTDEREMDNKKLILADIWNHEVYNWLNDYEPVDTIKSSDITYCYQLDSDFNTPKLNFKSTFSYKSNVQEVEKDLPRPNPKDDVALVPVFSQIQDESQGSSHPYYSNNRRSSSFGIPFFVEIPYSKMDDLNSVEEIVLRGYSRFTERKNELETYLEDREKFWLDLESQNCNETKESETSHVNGNERPEFINQTSNSNSNSGESWEMVEGNQIQQVSLNHDDLPKDSIAEIRQGEGDTMIVETSDVDTQPISMIQSQSESSGPLKTQDGSQEAGIESSENPNHRQHSPPFTMLMKVRSPGKILPADGDLMEELGERLDRLKSQREEIEKAKELKSQSESFGKDHSGSTGSNVEDEKKEKGKQIESEQQDEEPFPLIYTGSALVVRWKPQAKDYFFAGIENETSGKHFGKISEEIKDPAIIKEEEASKNSEGGRFSRKRKDLTLEDCLDEFTKEEKLGQDDPWYCPKCKDFRQATKKFDLWKVPDILVVHLKRFSGGNRRNKLDENIDFPLENLDLSKRVVGTKIYQDLEMSGELPPKSVSINSENDPTDGMQGIEIQDDDEAVASDQPIYDLFAVDNHYGGLGGGHYTAYAKNSRDKAWYSFDDSSTSKVGDVNSIKTPAAYLLFYCRRTEREIGGKTRDVIKSVSSASQTVPGDLDSNNSNHSIPSNLASASFLPPQEQSYESFTNYSGNDMVGMIGGGSMGGGGFIRGDSHLNQAPPYSRSGEIEEDELTEATQNSDQQNDYRGPSGFPAHLTSPNSWENDLEELTSPSNSSVGANVGGSPVMTPPQDPDFNHSILDEDYDKDFGNGNHEYHAGNQVDLDSVNQGVGWDQRDPLQGLSHPPPPPAPAPAYQPQSQENTEDSILNKLTGENDPMQLNPNK